MANEKIYVNGVSVKERTFDYQGEQIVTIALGFNKKKFIEFLNSQEGDYVNVDLNRRRTVSEYGETHTATLNTYKPKVKAEETEDTLPF